MNAPDNRQPIPKCQYHASLTEVDNLTSQSTETVTHTSCLVFEWNYLGLIRNILCLKIPEMSSDAIIQTATLFFFEIFIDISYKLFSQRLYLFLRSNSTACSCSVVYNGLDFPECSAERKAMATNNSPEWSPMAMIIIRKLCFNESAHRPVQDASTRHSDGNVWLLWRWWS